MGIDNLKTFISAIDTRSLVEKVEMKLMEIFIEKELKPGDSIPTELELTELMGVSRTVVRESITRLKTRGMIESKKHKGAVIKTPDLAAVFQNSMIPRMLDDSTLKDIFEMRLVIEVGMADLLIKRVKPEDIEELYAIVGTEPDKTGDMLFDIEHEVKFHGRLYEITGNETLKNFQNLLLPVFNYVYSSGLMETQHKQKRHVSHHGLVDLLKAGNAKDLRQGIRMHLENHYQRIFYRDANPLIKA
jgi:DNA-binding FadR family transcriptional regulator